jgi:hypothetical protein
MSSTNNARHDGREHSGAGDSDVRISNWSLATGSTPGRRGRR